MLRRSVVLLFSMIVLVISGCSQFSQPAPAPALSGVMDQKFCELLDFNKIVIQGPIDATVTPPQKKKPPNTITICGDSTIVGQVNYSVVNGTLLVTLNEPQAARIKVIITTPAISSIKLTTSASLEANQLNAKYLSVMAQDKTQLVLSGYTSRVDIYLSNQAKLNAKYLFTDTIFINAADSSQAEILNNGAISSFATNSSNIYYYDDPKMVATYYRQSGSVMRMRGLDYQAPAYAAPFTNNVYPKTISHYVK